MNLRDIIKYIFFVLLMVTAGYVWWSQRPVRHGPGMVAPAQPIQTAITDPQPFHFKKYRLTPLAHYDIEARVLGKERYYLGRGADLCPIDLALGWGPMSDNTRLRRITIRQSGRYYLWSMKDAGVPRDQITRNSANVHMIAGTAGVARQLRKVRRGHVVRIKGYLVQAAAPDGWRQVSSLSRTDTHGGSCELLFATQLDFVVPQLPPITDKR